MDRCRGKMEVRDEMGVTKIEYMGKRDKCYEH